jgi:hypothetical protein
MHTRRSLVPIVVPLFLACSNAVSVDRGLTVSITTNRAVVSATQPVEIAVTVSNHSSRAAVIWADCGPYFVVFDQAHRIVGPPGRFCAAMLNPPRILAPGESFTIRDEWSGEGGRGDALEADRLPAGTYQLVGRIFGRIFGQRRELTSEGLTATLLADPATS